MTDIPAKLRARVDRKSAKRDEKKRQTADGAIMVLQVLGFADTSLRDYVYDRGKAL